jgi:hypothetical protein
MVGTLIWEALIWEALISACSMLHFAALLCIGWILSRSLASAALALQNGSQLVQFGRIQSWGKDSRLDGTRSGRIRSAWSEDTVMEQKK